MKASMKSIKRWIRVKKAALVAVAIYALVSLLLGSPHVKAQSQGNMTTYSRNYRITPESFSADRADVKDGCVNPGGPYKLLRFDTVVPNKGNADIVVGTPPPDGTSDSIFVWSEAHGHHHIRGFYTLDLVSNAGTPQANGFKQGFCLIDYELQDPNAPPAKYMECHGLQGVQPGWADVYCGSSGSEGVGICASRPTVPCQFIKIDGVPDGTYRVFSTSNASRIVPESNTHDNSFSDVITIAGDTVTVKSAGWLSSQLIVPASLGPSRSSMTVVTRGVLATISFTAAAITNCILNGSIRLAGSQQQEHYLLGDQPLKAP